MLISREFSCFKDSNISKHIILQATHETKFQLQNRSSKGRQEKRDSWALKGKVGFQKSDKKGSTEKQVEIYIS
jgi:hypothetical protein